ncbi:hypothetical protein ACFWD7_54180 [Streptomyces mirabilis]|uniref:hypothetical protein n=1 Tax=Streptomyces mirabilis TaxID=68239 RepID=UPI003694627E
MTSTTTRKASTAGFDLTRSRTLAQALQRRMRQERLRNFATVFMPFVLTVTVAVVLPLVSDDSSMNGAADSARLGMEYGANADAVATGLLLVLIRGVIAVHPGVHRRGAARLRPGRHDRPVGGDERARHPGPAGLQPTAPRRTLRGWQLTETENRNTTTRIE